MTASCDPALQFSPRAAVLAPRGSSRPALRRSAQRRARSTARTGSNA